MREVKGYFGREKGRKKERPVPLGAPREPRTFLF
jgi:hypothetical protein